MSETYLFMSNPRPVASTRPKYRDPEDVRDEIAATSNLMWDHRVVRGMPSGKPVQVAGGVLGVQEFRPTASQLRREAKKKKEKLIRRGIIRPAVPSVAEIHAAIKVPKKRVEVPLHLYLQEQVEEVKTHTLSAQTDAFVQEEYELKEPVYIQRKTGTDMGTQVDNKLVFNFDTDVAPVLETVISKTLEQSLMEVRHEEQMDFMRLKMEKMVEKRELQKRVMKKREDEERLLEDAKNKLRDLALKRKAAEAMVQKKVASRAYGMQFLHRLHQDLCEHLSTTHYFEEPLDAAVRNFMPWLYKRVRSQIGSTGESQKVLDDMLTVNILNMDAQKKKAANDRKEARYQEEVAARQREMNRHIAQQRRRRIELSLKCEAIQEEPIGPIYLTGENTFEDLQSEVLRLVSELEEVNERDSPIQPDDLRFLWDGKQLVDKDIILYELGVEDLHKLQLVIETPPKPVTPEPEPDTSRTSASGSGGGDSSKKSEDDEES